VGVISERQQVKAELRRLKREALPELRRALAQTKRQKKNRLKQCRAECRMLTKQARARARTAEKKLREHLARLRISAKLACASCVNIDAKALDRMNDLADRIRAEQSAIAGLRNKLDHLRSTKGQAGGRRSAELRAEHDDEVRRDLGDDPALLALWQKVKSKIRGSKNRTRTEAFFEYVHDHPEKTRRVTPPTRGAIRGRACRGVRRPPGPRLRR